MPKEKKYLTIIEKIYRRNYEDIGMFFYVEGQKHLVPAITIEQAIYNYFRYVGVDDFNIESTISTYTKLKNEFYEAAKTTK